MHVASYEGNREVPMPDLSSEKVFPAKDRVKALFDPSLKWQLVEEYGVDSFTEQDDGSLLFEHEYADDEGLLSWMLSCRDKVTVLEPERIREKLYQITSEIAKRYDICRRPKGGGDSKKENENEKQGVGRDRPSE